MEPEKTNEVAAPVVETPAVEAPEVSPMELTAMAQGWQNKDAWVAAGNDEKDHRSAREFIDRGELLGKLKANSQEVRQLKDSLSAMTAHNQKVYQAGIEQGIKQLKQERANALRDGDVEQAMQIEEQIDTRKEALAEVKIAARIQANQATQQGPSVEFQTWAARNPWYTEDPVLHHWSKGMAIEYARGHPDADEAEVYAMLDREVRKNFPSKFAKGPPNPDGGGRQTSAPSKNTGGKSEFERLMATLPDDQQRMARSFVKAGMKPEKYVEDYNSMNS